MIRRLSFGCLVINDRAASFHAHDDGRSCPNIDEVEIIVIESELRNDAHESLKNRCRVIPVAKPGSLLWQRRAALAWLHASLADKSAGSSVQLPCYLVIPLVICTWCFDSIYSLSLSLFLNGITIIHPPWIAPTLTCLNNLSTFYISHFYKIWYEIRVAIVMIHHTDHSLLL